MCPACIATAVLIVAGATSTGGLTAFAVTKLRPRINVKTRVSAVPPADPGAQALAGAAGLTAQTSQ